MMVDWGEMGQRLIDLGVAYVLALPIGWERERADRSAGLRTFPLVAIASCAFLLAAEGAAHDSQARSRVIQGVTSGIGFIGGGAILKTEGSVRGTATAASLWATCAIGIAAATHNYDVAIPLSLVTLLTLRLLAPLKTDVKD